MLDAELVEDRHDGLADVVLGAVGVRERLDEQVDRPLAVAGVERVPRLGQVRLSALLEADARRQALGLEVAVDVLDELQRLVVLAARDARRRLAAALY